MKKPTIAGTTKECLIHYAANNWPAKGSRSLGAFQKPMIDFVGVGQGTIARWLRNESKPIGLVLIKLRFYFEAAGYQVKELRGLRGTVGYLLAEMLSYGVLTHEEATSKLSFTESHSVLRISHGGSSTTPERAQIIRELHKSFREKIQARREDLLREISPSSDEADTASAVVPFVRNEGASRHIEELTDDLLNIAAHQTMAIIPLLELVVAKSTREHRIRLRSLIGAEGMFRLSVASSRLCSEKAYEKTVNHG